MPYSIFKTHEELLENWRGCRAYNKELSVGHGVSENHNATLGNDHFGDALIYHGKE
jgi:hypothetical protein